MPKTNKNSVVDKLYFYENYRHFLKDYLEEQKRIKDSFSLRAFVKKAGFGSASYSSYIIEGKRNLTPKSIQKMLNGLSLKGKKARYFELLVYYTQAKSVEEKEKYFKKLQTIRKSTKTFKLNKDQILLYENWYTIAIREIVLTNKWDGDFEKLGGMLLPKITKTEAQKAVETLENINLITKDKNGNYVSTDSIISAENIPELYIKKFRRDMIYKGADAADTLTKKERNVSAATVTLSKKGFEKASKLIDEFREKMLELANEEIEDKDGVYQINIQAFPLATFNTTNSKE